MYFSRFVWVLAALSLVGATMVVRADDVSAQPPELNIESAELKVGENFDFVGSGRFGQPTKYQGPGAEVQRSSQMATAALEGCPQQVRTGLQLERAVECYNSHPAPGHYVLALTDSVFHDGLTVNQPDPDSRLTIVGNAHTLNNGLIRNEAPGILAFESVFIEPMETQVAVDSTADPGLLRFGC